MQRFMMQAHQQLSESKARLEGCMLEGAISDVVKGVTYIQVKQCRAIDDSGMLNSRTYGRNSRDESRRLAVWRAMQSATWRMKRVGHTC